MSRAPGRIPGADTTVVIVVAVCDWNTVNMAFLRPRPRRSAASLALHVLVAILVTLAVNGVIFGLGWAGAPADAARHNRLLPPGWVIGTVWLVLLTLVTVAYWWLASADQPQARNLAPWLLVLILFCLAYPFYTFGFRSLAMEIVANGLTIAGAATLALRALRASRWAATPLFLVATWVSYATFATLAGR